ncbi:two-component system OmpR family response regulator [Frondihabitans sp. PhB188]|uniref:response regulator transcription factor n=1 Tax=Frondihabitans sp. PhB188 TaxID=2485200 RepID=UPI000F498420|nr:response regulator transcription factor [Frondihabitans sp. PhB188]ROQ41582.1 two-component system OmpR family response regulator [Frondihabitans sp. PhB188]
MVTTATGVAPQQGDTPTREPQRPTGVLRVFVVDEEDPITRLLSIALGMEGWQVTRFPDGLSVLEAATIDAPDAMLLDMMLPDVLGTEVVSRLRERGVDTPVLFLTGRSSIDDRLAAYAAGADDYITKPFALEEVVATLAALFRKQGKLPTSVVRGDLVLDTATGQAWMGGRPLLLAPLDFAVVQELAQWPSGRQSRRALADRLTDRGFDFVAPNALTTIPAVTGAGPGGELSAVLRVSGADLVLVDVL